MKKFNVFFLETQPFECFVTSYNDLIKNLHCKLKLYSIIEIFFISGRMVFTLPLQDDPCSEFKVNRNVQTEHKS